MGGNKACVSSRACVRACVCTCFFMALVSVRGFLSIYPQHGCISCKKTLHTTDLFLIDVGLTEVACVHTHVRCLAYTVVQTMRYAQVLAGAPLPNLEH